MNEPDPDAELLSRVARDDPTATREMVARKLPRLLALATRLLGDRDEARDVTQDAFLRLWKEAAAWRPGAARFDTWLHRVVLNLCYDRLRHERRRAPQSLDELPEAMDDAPLQEERMTEHAQRARVQNAIAALPARQREALILQYYQELSNVEAAQVLDISVDALESLLSRARRSLRTALMEDHAGPSHASAPVEKKEQR